MKSKKVWFRKALPAALLSIPMAYAGSATASDDWFAGLGLTQNRLQIAESEFRSYSLAGHGGRWLWPGVGLQLSAGLPLDDASTGEVTVKLESLVSVGLRLEGSAKENNGVAASLVAGGAITNIDASSALSNENSSYTGHFISGGLAFVINPATQVLFDYSYYHFESNVRVSDLKISYRIQF